MNYWIGTSSDDEPAPYIGARETKVDILARLKWTTELPTEAGLYRVFFEDVERRFKHSGDIADWENIIKNDLGSIFVEHPDDNDEFIDDYIKIAEKDGYRVYWLGPIPVPAPPDL